MDEPRRSLLFRAGETRAPISLTALRIGIGVVMVVHGWQKLTDIASWKAGVAELGIPAPEVAAWLAVAGELLGGLGLLVGLLTPLAGFGVLCVMLTAIFTVHLENGLLASNNGFELPMMLALVAAFFVARGAGPASVDAWIARHRGTPRAEPSTPHARRDPAVASAR